MKKKLFRLFTTPIVPSFIAGIVTMLGAGIANAQLGSAPTLVTSATNLDQSLFCPIVDVMFWVLISVSIIMVLWAAYLYVIAADDTDKPSQARKMVLYAAIGIVIALLAKGLPQIVASLFGQSSGDFSLVC